jgi:hypothetical protein
VDELIAQITEKTSVSAEKAKEIVGVVNHWLMDHLPDDVVEQVGGMLSGAGDIASSAAGKATGAAGSAMGAVTGAAGGLWDKAKGMVPGSESDDEE